MDIVQKKNELAAEQWREYVVSTGEVYRIANPDELIVVGDSHRVVDKDGVVHRPPRFNGKEYVVRWMPRDRNNPVQF